MRRGGICILIAFVLVFGLALPCGAAEETGSIRITLNKEEDMIYYGAVALYRVGTPVSEGYRLGSGFGGGFVSEEDSQAPALAQWLTERVGTADGIRILDSDGCGEFRSLEKGLYLIIQTDPAEGYYPFVPFLIQLPYEGQWNILAFPKLELQPVVIPQTGQDSGLYVSMAVMALSGLGLIFFLRRKTNY